MVTATANRKPRTSTTSQKHAELKGLSAQTQRNIYHMLQLADEILRDAEYVDKFGGESQLIDSLEQNEFSHFGGNPTLGSMLRAYRANPKQETWQEYAYNLRVMIDLATPANDTGDIIRINWKAKVAELEDKLDVALAERDAYKKMFEEANSRAEKSAAEAAELRGELKAYRSQKDAA